MHGILLVEASPYRCQHHEEVVQSEFAPSQSRDSGVETQGNEAQGEGEASPSLNDEFVRHLCWRGRRNGPGIDICSQGRQACIPLGHGRVGCRRHDGFK